ncbi:hypothetical protein ACP70R_015722 [Stipagrostis hirtigluma subsp. patula]
MVSLSLLSITSCHAAGPGPGPFDGAAAAASTTPPHHLSTRATTVPPPDGTAASRPAPPCNILHHETRPGLPSPATPSSPPWQAGPLLLLLYIVGKLVPDWPANN